LDLANKIIAEKNSKENIGLIDLGGIDLIDDFWD
jgi:hypothetical protein